jgi:hypothetical protein
MDLLMVMPKASPPQKLMTACAQCMMPSDVLILFMLCISNHNRDKERAYATYEMDRPYCMYK